MFETRYGPIEDALMVIHRIPEGLRSAFRARLAGLQREGLLGPKNQVGKGQKLVYGPDELHRLVFASELLEFGVARLMVLLIVEKHWDPQLNKIFADAELAAMLDPGAHDVVLYVAGARLMEEALCGIVPSVESCRLGELPALMPRWLAPDDPVALPPRLMVANLSARLRAFHNTFADAYVAELLDERRRLDEEIAAVRSGLKSSKG
jgi:hypothetical protein